MLNSSITEQNLPFNYLGELQMPCENGSFLEEDYWKTNIQKKINEFSKDFSEKINNNVLEEIRSNTFIVNISVFDDNEDDDIQYIEELCEFDKVLNRRIEQIYMDRRSMLKIQGILEEHNARYLFEEDYGIRPAMEEILECCNQIVKSYNELEDFLYELHNNMF